MNLTRFVTLGRDERAVTPVVGVVLLVGIATIMASIVGTFALGMAGDVDVTPQASFQYDHDGAGQFTITHGGGDSFDRLEVFVDGIEDDDWSGPVSPGDTFTSSGTYTDGSVTVIWTDSRSGRTAVVSRHEL